MSKQPLGDSADRFARRIGTWLAALTVVIAAVTAALRVVSDLSWLVLLFGAIALAVAGIVFLLEQDYRAGWNVANDLQQANDELTAHLRARSSLAPDRTDESTSAKKLHGPLSYRMATVAIYHERIRNPLSQVWVRAALLGYIEYPTVRLINEVGTMEDLWDVRDQVDELIHELRPSTRKKRRRRWVANVKASS